MLDISPFLGLGLVSGPLAASSLSERSSHTPTPSPQGLPGLAGVGSLKACELTLGTELRGPWSWQG